MLLNVIKHSPTTGYAGAEANGVSDFKATREVAEKVARNQAQRGRMLYQYVVVDHDGRVRHRAPRHRREGIEEGLWQPVMTHKTGASRWPSGRPSEARKAAEREQFIQNGFSEDDFEKFYQTGDGVASIHRVAESAHYRKSLPGPAPVLSFYLSCLGDKSSI
jgi:hypothetical protein